MLKRISLMLAVCFVLVSLSEAAVVGKVDVPDTMDVGTEKLILNGAGVREKKIAFVNKDIYVAGLYLKQKSSNAEEILAADETMALRIKIISGLITSDRFTEHARGGFEESTNGNTDAIRSEIDLFLNTFGEKIKKGDLFEIVYKKGVGVQTFKNGNKTAVVTIPGYKIKPALFGIWIGKRSEKNLQILADELLGKHVEK